MTRIIRSFSTVLFGPGLLSTREAQHRRQRKSLNPVFSVSHLREMTDILYTVSHKVRSRLGTDMSLTVRAEDV